MVRIFSRIPDETVKITSTYRRKAEIYFIQ